MSTAQSIFFIYCIYYVIALSFFANSQLTIMLWNTFSRHSLICKEDCLSDCTYMERRGEQSGARCGQQWEPLCSQVDFLGRERKDLMEASMLLGYEAS